MKKIIKKLLPEKLLKKARPYYHGFVALVGHVYFGLPSRKLTIIGVTGTAGKSTTINLLAHLLNTSQKKTGFITTANYSFGDEVFINKNQLSMPSGQNIAKQLSLMKKNNCEYAIIECTSEGLAQNRHLGIKFTGALFTNLSPAHIDAHGSLKKYRAAKIKLIKSINGKEGFIGVNLDDENAKFFLRDRAEKKFGVTMAKKNLPGGKTYTACNLTFTPNIAFDLDNLHFQVPLIGKFNAYNSLLAVACADNLGIDLKNSATAIAGFKTLPGRMESIPNNLGISIFVDYAPEPSGMQNSLETVNQLPHKKIIHVFGTTGGHRDTGKRFEFGEISARLADTIILTNDDIYDSDPNQIAQNTITGINRVPKQEKKASDIIIMLDRKSAITHALRLAKPGDIVIITGKGSEQFLVLPGNRKIEWDEREVVREELEKLNS